MIPFPFNLAEDVTSGTKKRDSAINLVSWTLLARLVGQGSEYCQTPAHTWKSDPSIPGRTLLRAEETSRSEHAVPR